MFKALKQMFQKKSAGEITVKVNVDTSEAKEAINDFIQEARNGMNELSHIKLVTNDDDVPDLYIDGVTTGAISKWVKAI
ncbi:hypothetical protein G7084_04195 [Weissella coleopterorum]|uniref:Uncharacterized protein n=1 Tax=Weissella coleopterorum TaxID=2714949 RepID=A0A6G8AZQ9_9LACO|nr:hypothetical protein [Weissella coleopterorum]QIL50581.1 hypothetical protein G7084_04195 [Weissella coleopterorum]